MASITITGPPWADREALGELAKALATEGFSVHPEEPRPALGYAVTWWEVFDIVIDFAGDAADWGARALVVKEVLRIGRNFTRRRRRRGAGRPQHVRIKDREGNILQEHHRSPAPAGRPRRKKKPAAKRPKKRR